MNTKKKIILASNSPRRRELMAGLDLPFEVRVLEGVDESYPADMEALEVSEYIAHEKAAAYRGKTAPGEILLTADTTVVCDGEIMGKPHDADDARRMLSALSGKSHQVVTGVCLVGEGREKSFSVVTEVTFKQLTSEEIDYYITHYRPFDKAGAYGIQEWIGYIGCTGLRGSYFNVMGLPVQRIYEELQDM